MPDVIALKQIQPRVIDSARLIVCPGDDRWENGSSGIDHDRLQHPAFFSLARLS